jgi:hypothetical protein
MQQRDWAVSAKRKRGAWKAACIALCLNALMLFATPTSLPAYAQKLSRRTSLSTLLMGIALYLLNTNGAWTTSAILEFTEITKAEVQASVPRLLSSFPNARFYSTGLSGPSGIWQFIRIEDSSACEGAVCPTVVRYNKNEWKLLFKAEKEISVSISLENGEYIQFNLKLKGGHDAVLRFKASEQLLYIDQ